MQKSGMQKTPILTIDQFDSVWLRKNTAYQNLTSPLSPWETNKNLPDQPRLSGAMVPRL